MGFQRLTSVHYRNLKDGTVDLNKKNIVLVGSNGQGKTNFLESLYYLCFAASFRTKKEKLLVRNGEKEFSVSGRFFSDFSGAIDIAIYGGDKRKIVLNGKAVSSRVSLVGQIPCIVFCHDDIDFINGIPERKRQFTDQTLSFLDQEYLSHLINYKKMLKMRAILLKDRKHDQLDVVEIQMAETGLKIILKRRGFIEDFHQGFSREFMNVSDMDETATMKYWPSWKTLETGEIQKILLNSRDTDMRMGFTTTGPHRDKIEFYSGKKVFSDIASTGQLRLASLVLRSAQASFVAQKAGQKPVLLVDDVLLELDPEKKRKFLANLCEYEQAFFTFLPEERGMGFLNEDRLVYNVSEGGLNPCAI